MTALCRLANEHNSVSTAVHTWLGSQALHPWGGGGGGGGHPGGGGGGEGTENEAPLVNT